MSDESYYEMYKKKVARRRKEMAAFAFGVGAANPQPSKKVMMGASPSEMDHASEFTATPNDGVDCDTYEE